MKRVEQPLYYRWLWQLIGAVMILAVITVSLLPSPPQPPVMQWDKLQHLAAYTVLMLWFGQLDAGRLRWSGWLIMLGILLEIVQGLSGYRSFEFADMLANPLGVFIGLGLVRHTPLGRSLAAVDRSLPRPHMTQR